MATPANFVSRSANAGNVVGFKQRRAVLCAEAAAVQPFFEDLLNLGVWHRQ
jgi:hypothetical protein